MEIHEIGKKKQKIGDLEIKTFKTVHTENSIGYVVRCGGKKIVYTGDTGYFPGLRKVASGADIFVTECALPDSEKMSRSHDPFRHSGDPSGKQSQKNCPLASLPFNGREKSFRGNKNAFGKQRNRNNSGRRPDGSGCGNIATEQLQTTIRQQLNE